MFRDPYLPLALLGATLLAWPFIARPLIARVFGAQIGAKALAKQPDRISFAAASANAWNRVEDARAFGAGLQHEGFASAGVQRIVEMPGLVIELFASEGERVYGCVYEHPLAGVWAEVFVHYEDGTSLTVSSNPPTGLRPRPGHVVLNVRGGRIPALLAALRQQGETAPRRETPLADACERFAAAYAESVAWRKGAGISREEVVAVSDRRVA